MLKQFKIITLTPTCFFSRRKHHQGTFLYLAKSTKWFFCARRYRCSQCYGSISACCARLHNRQTFVSKLCYFVNQLTVSQKNSNQSVATSPKPVSLVWQCTFYRVWSFFKWHELSKSWRGMVRYLMLSEQ